MRFLGKMTLMAILFVTLGCNNSKRPTQIPKTYGSDLKLSDGPTLSDVYEATKDSPRLVDTPGGGKKIVYGNQ